MNKELLEAVRRLLSDIEGMELRPGWYGEFLEHEAGYEGGAIVEWPNLAISAAKVHELLEE